MGGKGKPVGISDMLPQIIDEVSKLWPSCKIVHGRARHSPSQGGVERLNQTVQKRLNAWMTETNSKSWSVGCKFVQWGIATDYSSTVKASPYSLAFGQAPRYAVAHIICIFFVRIV
jgi:hypothetical protein